VAAVARSIGRALAQAFLRQATSRERPLLVVNKSTVPVGSGDYVSMLIREGLEEAGEREHEVGLCGGLQPRVLKRLVCIVSSPSHQIRELQSRPTEVVIEPDTKVVQSHPRRQSSTQTLDLVGTLPPQAEGVEELVVDRLDDLTDGGSTHLLRRLGQVFLELRLGGWITSAP
jgi:hypothetical protein